MKYLMHILSLTALTAMLIPTAHAGPIEDAALLPNSTTMIMQVDFKALKGTKLFNELVASHPAYAVGIAAIQAKSGINIASQLNTVTMGFFNDGQGEPIAILLDAPFSESAPGLKDPKVQKKTHAGQTYYLTGAKKGAVANYKGHFLMTSEPRMQAILGGKAGLTPALAKRSNSRDKGAQIWIFGTPPAKMMKKGGNEIKNVKSVNASIDLSKGLRIQADIDANAEIAGKVVAKFEQEKAKAGQNPMMAAMGLAPIFQKLSLTASGSALSLKLSLTDAEVTQLTNVVKMMMAQKQRRRPPMPGMKPPGMVAPPATPFGKPLAPKAPSTVKPLPMPTGK